MQNSARPKTAPAAPETSRFLGDYRAERCVGEFALAELQPTVPEEEVQEHTHHDAHFLLLLDGTYLSSAAGMPPACNARTLILNPPGTSHRDRFRGLEGRFFTLSIPAATWAAAAEQRKLPPQATRLSGSGLVRANQLRWELANWSSASSLVVETGIEDLLDQAAVAARFINRAGPAWLERARERLRDEWMTTPSLASLAREVEVHPVYFARSFRRRYGCSPGQYLRRCRLEEAVRLLQDSRLGLAEIALRCGYVDQSHFSNAFRRAFGGTPAQYRGLN